MSEPARIQIPRLFAASDGHTEWLPPPGGQVGLLLRDTTLATLATYSNLSHLVAVDIDGVAGLSDDRAGCEFLIRRLGFRMILAHHPAAAANIADLGALALLRVFAVDSSGLRSSLESSPRQDGIGSAVSPGLVLPHLAQNELAMLPRPILAYGLLERPTDIAACLTIADSVVVDPGARGPIDMTALARAAADSPLPPPVSD